ncbi:MAG: carboxypeptidase regulatory-like domain-containing protein [Ruminococcaceae bacterium]|nr:carboxypeptidase regulatory-like domain-containing protein [Oscillospiraceae bacterium]
MESKKSKIFTKKLIALFLSALMAISCFTGALTAYARAEDYHDENLAYNFLAWAETTDEQTAEAILDWADANLSWTMKNLVGFDEYHFSQNIVVATIKIDAYLDSVDGLIYTVEQADDLLDSYGGLVGGDVKNINLNGVADLAESYSTSASDVVSKCGRSYRAKYTAKEILIAVARLLYDNTKDGNNVFRKLVIGDFNLGTILGGVVSNLAGSSDIFDILKDTLGMWDNYQNDLAYNVVANLIFTNTKWYTDEELATYKATDSNGNLTNWNFDTRLFEALSTQLLQQINAEITYQEKNNDLGTPADSSKTRYAALKAYAEDNGQTLTDENTAEITAAYNAANGTDYDGKLHYTDEGNVYLFRYDSDVLTVETTDNLLDVAYDAAKIAWNTALKATIGLLHVNYDNHDDTENTHGTNFDNHYYLWRSGKYGWSTANKGADMYDHVDEWIAEIAPGYGLSAAKMKEYIKTNLTFDRSISEDAEGNWRDIKSKSLFVKLRYSPMADYYFDVQTGPINLYFEQTGTKEIDDFITAAFDNDEYSSIPAALNDLLVAATKVLFPESSNIGFQGSERGVVATDLHVPTMVTTGNMDLTGSGKAANIRTSAETLVSNALAMFEYAANAADPYIFNQFYKDHNITYNGTTNLTEGNFEEAAIPLAVAAVVQNVSIANTIHHEDWDKVKDAEGAGYLALAEYLSYVLPDRDYSNFVTYDADGKIEADFDTCILPMARDAVGYVVQAFVPVRNTDGSEWNVYDTTTSDSSSIWDLANSVVCYYASDYKYPAVKGGSSTTAQSKSVATLLGVADSSGKALVQPTNSLWTNVDNVVNKLLPIMGELQYGTSAYSGQFSSEDLIYNDIIKNILNIGGEDGNGTGITDLLERVYTICCSEPISSKGIDEMVYDDIVVSIINNLLGPRYGKGYNQILPTYAELNSATPFDTMLHVSWLGNYKGNGSAGTVTSSNDLGYLSLLVANLYTALGGFDGVNATGPKGAWTALMFAASAVNSFVPDFTPQIGPHTFGAVTASVQNASISGLTAAGTLDTNYLNIKNGSIGINRAYNTTGRTDGQVVQDNRLYVEVTGIDVEATTNSSGASTTTTSQINLAKKTATIAPEATEKIAITGKAPSAAIGSILYTFTIHYNVTLGNGGEALYTDLKTKTFMYHTIAKGWKENAYSGNTLSTNSSYYNEVDCPSGSSGFRYRTPKDFIVPMSDPESINTLTFYMKNRNNPLFGDGYKAMDGIFTYAKSGVKYYAVSNGTVASTQSTASGTDTTLAYAAIDKSNGSIINYDLYDYYYNGTWYRGSKNTNSYSASVDDNGSGGGLSGGYEGYTADEIAALDSSIQNSDGFSTRPHVVWTFDEALASGAVTGVDREIARVRADGTTEYLYNAVFVRPTTGLLQGNYGNSKSKVSISWGTPVPGIYFGVGKNRLKKNTEDNSKVFLKYDGTTELSKFMESVQIDFFRNNDEAKTTFNLYVADDTQAAVLQQAYEADIQTMAAYQDSDLSDYDGTSSAIYESLQNGFQLAVAKISEPINQNNARTLGSETIRATVTSDTTKETGDKAYQPVPTSVALPSAMLISAVKGDDGYWYNDVDCQLPIYYADDAHKLTDSDVTNGEDAVGMPVTKVDGVWYVANQAKYKQEWDTTTYTYPYLVDTSEVETDSTGATIYKQVQFVYRDTDGNKVNSTDDPTYKLPEGQTITKPNDGTEYRSEYEGLSNNLDYWMEQVKKNVKNAANRIVEGVSEDREGLNNVNFIVANYEAMVKVAKEAEGILATEWTPVATTDTTYQYDTDYYAANATGGYDKVEEYNIGDAIDGTLYVYEPTYTTEASAVEISEAIRVYELYKARADATHISYKAGNRLESEIDHASGNAYSAYTATKTSDEAYRFTYSTKGAHESDPVYPYSVSTTASEVRFGTVKNGEIVNEDAEGNKAYTDASWKAYIDALGAAVDTAQTGRADATSLDAEVSDCYTAKSHLIIAENNLEEFVGEPEGEGYTVTGTVKVATEETGTNFAPDSKVADATVDVLDANGAVVATTTTDSDGKFSIVVPDNGVSIKISKYCVNERVITLNGEAVSDYPNIPVVAVDYDSNGVWGAGDNGLYKDGYNSQNPDMDLDGNGAFGAGDNAIYKGFSGKSIRYADLTL